MKQDFLQYISQNFSGSNFYITGPHTAIIFEKDNYLIEIRVWKLKDKRITHRTEKKIDLTHVKEIIVEKTILSQKLNFDNHDIIEISNSNIKNDVISEFEKLNMNIHEKRKTKSSNIINNWMLVSILILFILSMINILFAIGGIILTAIMMLYVKPVYKDFVESIKDKSELVENIRHLTHKNNALQNLYDIKQNDLVNEYKIKTDNLVNEYEKLENEKINILNNKIQKKEEESKYFSKKINEKNKELNSLKDSIVKEYNNKFKEDIYIDNFEEISSAEIKNELSMIKTKEKELLDNNGVYIYDDISKKSHLNNQVKQITRSFNSETDFFLSNVTAKNIDTYRQRIIKSFEAHNRIYKTDQVELSKKLLELKLEQLNLVYSYQIKLDQERDLQRAAREEIREQQKVERELENKRKVLEKEESHFKNEVQKMIKYLQKTESDIEKELYLEKIKELEAQITNIDNEKNNVEQRAQNTRAGYVYIISNIGSFGENIYKIGVTRRLEPMDRIKELGDASVPFEFDVHAIIFSEDAPGLESTLHNHFRDKEVNKVNHRKEFFNVDLSEIEQIVKEEYNNTVNFTLEPKAEQYKESMRISS